MFLNNKKKAKRQEIYLSNSTIVALEVANKVLNFIFQGKFYKLIHASLKFKLGDVKVSKLSQGGTLATFPSQQEAEVTVYFAFSTVTLEYTIKMILQSGGRGWMIVSDSEVFVQYYNERDIIGLIYNSNDSFTSAPDSEEQLKKMQKHFTEIYPLQEGVLFKSVTPKSEQKA